MQFQAPQIGVIPIRNINFTTPEPTKKDLASKGEALYQEHIKSGNKAMLDFIEDCLPKDKDGNFAMEKDKSDVVHDVLAFLAERMIELNKDKQTEALEDFHVGNLYVNRKCTGALVGAHPFGGFNMSGTDSKAGGRDYLLLFLQAKSMSTKVS